MKLIKQYDAMDCGPACLAMISNFYGVNYSLQALREMCYITKEGVSLLGINQAAEKIGFETFSATLSTDQLKKMQFPCILHWNNNHFVVLEKYVENKSNSKNWHIVDPGHGKISLSEERLIKSWLNDEKGVALFLSPKESFYTCKNIVNNHNKSIKGFLTHLKPYKIKLLIIFFLMLFGSVISMAFPFLSQFLIDEGVVKKDVSYIELILISQISLFIGIIVIEIFRNWLMLFIGSRLGIDIISAYLLKLLKLPLKFFDSKMTGDFHQRIQDNERIEQFLTSQSLLTFFSIVTFSVFLIILGYYNFSIFLLYLFLTIISILWSNYFLKKRRVLDYYRFQQNSQNQDSIYEILNGVTEMKLNNFENFKINEWKKIQENLFNINLKILKVDQFQLSGFEFFNQLKNIFVTFLAALLIVQDKMSFGTLLSISYIIGMMNSPVNQLVSFFRSLQDAKISLERLNEVDLYPPEENEKLKKINFTNNKSYDININNLYFQYEGPKSPMVLKNINFSIPDGKITAIVGASGSGKTSLMKLLLKVYDPTKGNIYIHNENIKNISSHSLRENTGVVMQDGYIFSDSIERNIATSDEIIDNEKLLKSIKIANLEEFINTLPLNTKTRIGSSGNGISGGQKQRILIARAVYKNPNYIFFDEATSALDAENEKIIHDNLQEFFKGKTVVIIAHRLSTVKNADKIIVIKKGEILEQGNHHELVIKKGEYFNLVKNQLELGE